MESRENILKIIAFVLLCFSISLNFKVWVYDFTFLNIKYSRKLYIQPSLISTMISLFLFGGFIIRNANDIFKDNLKIAFCVIDLFFFSGFIAMFADGKTNFLGFSSHSLLLLMIVLMWIGMKSLLRYILLAFISSSFFFIGQLNEAMGIFGALYILFAFFSFSIQIYTNIFPMVNNLNSEFFGSNKKLNKNKLLSK